MVLNVDRIKGPNWPARQAVISFELDYSSLKAKSAISSSVP